MLTEIITESTTDEIFMEPISYVSSIFLGKGLGKLEEGRWPAVEFGLMLD